MGLQTIIFAFSYNRWLIHKFCLQIHVNLNDWKNKNKQKSEKF